MVISNFSKNKHLLWRAGFGPQLSEIPNLEIQNPKETWKNLISKRPFKEIKFSTEAEDLDYSDLKKLDADQRKVFQQKKKKQNAELNQKFLMEMVNSEDQLREKMAFFWHGHFACRINNPDLNQQLINIIRENALGNFGDLLFAVSKSPAMLSFLNNQQNKKAHPNENFAREVMELFTMGRGNYTEKDVKEGARAFTGWAFNKNGEFVERMPFHDEGSKTFLGKVGHFDGNDILKIILGEKVTAQFITLKIYKFFVNEKYEPKRIALLAEDFYKSGYDIKKLMTEIFTSNWFYEEENVGAKIKSPIELMAGILRTLPINTGNPQKLMLYQKLLGQILFYPPNVAGWPNGKSWIDSSTLLLRMQMPQIWSGTRPLEAEAKPDDDLDMGLKNNQNKLGKKMKNLAFEINWQPVETALNNKNIAEVILQKTKSLSQATVQKFSNGSVKNTVIDVMSTPEYQLC